jgi:hypothetical protein
MRFALEYAEVRSSFPVTPTHSFVMLCFARHVERPLTRRVSDLPQAASEIVGVICDDMLHKDLGCWAKLARLYLISDILHNSSAPVPNASAYRSSFQPRLLAIFENLHQVLLSALSLSYVETRAF